MEAEEEDQLYLMKVIRNNTFEAAQHGARETLLTQRIASGTLLLRRRTLAERLALEKQLLRWAPRFVLLSVAAVLFLLATQFFTQPSTANNVRSLLVSRFGLDAVPAISSWSGVLGYLRQFHEAAGQLHPVSTYYLPDPLRVELLKGPMVFDEPTTLPAEVRPTLRPSFSLTAWLHVDATTLPTRMTRLTLVHKYLSAALNHVHPKTDIACWGWYYVARRSASVRRLWRGWQRLEFGRHAHRYSTVPADEGQLEAALQSEELALEVNLHKFEPDPPPGSAPGDGGASPGGGGDNNGAPMPSPGPGPGPALGPAPPPPKRRLRSRTRSGGKGDDADTAGAGGGSGQEAAAFVASDGPVFLTLVVNATSMTVQFYENGNRTFEEPLPVLVTDCSKDTAAAPLDVGYRGVGLAELRYYPRALDTSEVWALAELGQTVDHILTCSSEASSGETTLKQTVRSETHGILSAQATSVQEREHHLNVLAADLHKADRVPNVTGTHVMLDAAAFPANSSGPGVEPADAGPFALVVDPWSTDSAGVWSLAAPLEEPMSLTVSLRAAMGASEDADVTTFTVSQWVASTSYSGCQLAVEGPIAAGVGQCLSVCRFDTADVMQQHDEEVLQVHLGPRMTSPDVDSTNQALYCELPPPATLVAGRRNHMAITLSADAARETAELLVYLDGQFLCGYTQNYTSDRFTGLLQCLAPSLPAPSPAPSPATPPLASPPPPPPPLHAWVGQASAMLPGDASPMLVGLRLYELRVYPRRLSAAEVYALAFDAAGALRECSRVDDVVDDPTFRTPLGLGCASLALVRAGGFPAVCDAGAQAACPLACEVRVLCHLGGGIVDQSRLVNASAQEAAAAWAPVHILDQVVTMDSGGRLCVDEEVSNFTFRNQTSGLCAARLPSSLAVNRQAVTDEGTLAEQPHCEAERVLATGAQTRGGDSLNTTLIRNSWAFCRWPSQAFQPLTDLGWQQFTLEWWVKGRQRMPADTLFFVSSWPTQAELSASLGFDQLNVQTCFTVRYGVELTAYSPYGPAVGQTVSVSPREVYGAAVNTEWHFHAVSWDGTTEPPRLTLMVNGVYHTSVAVRLGCEAGVRMLVKDGPPLAISGLVAYPRAMVPAELQKHFYAEAPAYRAGYLEGAVSPAAEMHTPHVVEKFDYSLRTHAISPPTVYQLRAAVDDAACRTSFMDIVREDFAAKIWGRCDLPYRCDVWGTDGRPGPRAPSSVWKDLSMCTAEGVSATHFLRAPLTYEGQSVFAEFLSTLNVAFVVRDGEVLAPDLFIDLHTKRLTAMQVFYSPEANLASLLKVTFDLATVMPSGSWSLKHIKRQSELCPYLVAGLCAAAFDLALLFFVDILRPLCRGKLGSYRVYHALPDLTLRLMLLLLNGFLLWYSWQEVRSLTEVVSVRWPVASDVNEGRPEFENKINEYFTAVGNLFNDLHRHRMLLIALYALISLAIVRVISYLSIHPRTGLLVRTFELCADDLAHYMIIFLFVLFLFGALACSILGTDVPEFADVGTALHTGYKGFITGDMPDFSSDVFLGIFTILFMLVVWGCLLNFFLAIIVEAYLKAKEQVEEFVGEQDLASDFFDLVHYFVKARLYGWPSRGRLARVIHEELGGHIALAELLRDERFGFRSEESARAWYVYQCRYHKFCILEEALQEPEEREAQERTAGSKSEPSGGTVLENGGKDFNNLLRDLAKHAAAGPEAECWAVPAPSDGQPPGELARGGPPDRAATPLTLEAASAATSTPPSKAALGARAKFAMAAACCAEASGQFAHMAACEDVVPAEEVEAALQRMMARLHDLWAQVPGAVRPEDEV